MKIIETPDQILQKLHTQVFEVLGPMVELEPAVPTDYFQSLVSSSLQK